MLRLQGAPPVLAKRRKNWLIFAKHNVEKEEAPILYGAWQAPSAMALARLR